MEELEFEIPEFEEKTKKILKKLLPEFGQVANPLDLIAEANAEAYGKSIEALMQDNNVDMLAIVVLMQTPPVDERVLNVLIRASDDRRKPVVVISVGGSYTDNYRRVLESHGVPTYGYPLSAAKALEKLWEYARFHKK